MEGHSLAKHQLVMFGYYGLLVREDRLDRNILQLQMSCVPRGRWKTLFFIALKRRAYYFTHITAFITSR
jgi:hypothetical protein